ncbi:MAG: hypothetical protein CM1200mP29_06310 [Verrucomicrobiota bacterium]|nr:MAG: hypothetical protein CM1200mP29_06310 [Verrucomicrobiota bacterium]
MTGQETFIFGYARQTADSYMVGFTSKGDYTPIVSTYGEELNAPNGLGRIWMFSLALVALSFGIMFPCWRVGVHKLLVFLPVVSLFQGGGLVLLGLNDANRPRGLALAGSPAERPRKDGSRSAIWARRDWLVGNWDAPEVLTNNWEALDREKVCPGLQGIYGNTAANIGG